jgi:ADP-ribose pyrophosphatase YjhB (NUDIX family)
MLLGVAALLVDCTSDAMPISPYIRDLRAAVGTRRLLIPSVAGIIRDGERILLVQEREGGMWSTPGGALELDDTPANAVIREVFEETGLVVEPTRIFAVYGGPEFLVRYPNGDETQYVSTMFECRIVAGEIQPDGDEIQRAHFWTRDEAVALPLSPWLTRMIARLYDRATETWFEAPTWRP